MVSVATTASMDLTAVVPVLMHGIAQEVTVDVSELKVILVGDEGQFDLKPFQTLQAQYDKVEWDYAPFDQHHSSEPYIETRLKQDVPLLQPHSTSQQAIAYDVKGSGKFTQRDRPVSLYQVGSFGSCLSARRSRLVCAMEGDFNSKGAVKMGAVKSFQGGSHINRQVPEAFAQSPLPIESFSHIQTWHVGSTSKRYNPKTDGQFWKQADSGQEWTQSSASLTQWRPKLRHEKCYSSVAGDTSEASTTMLHLGSIDESDGDAVRACSDKPWRCKPLYRQ